MHVHINPTFVIEAIVAPKLFQPIDPTYTDFFFAIIDRANE